MNKHTKLYVKMYKCMNSSIGGNVLPIFFSAGKNGNNILLLEFYYKEHLQVNMCKISKITFKTQVVFFSQHAYNRKAVLQFLAYPFVPFAFLETA